jgi:hypothetical protein
MAEGAMRDLQPKRWLMAGVLAATFAVAGCSSMSENECLAMDWRMIGYEDGVVGYSGNRIGQHRKACAKYGVTPDLDQYQAGREQGLREFCKPMNGFRIGARGNGYNGVCPADLDQAFVAAYESGRQLNTLRSRVSATAETIDSMRGELDRIDQDLVSYGAEILNPTITHERRAHLLVESKQLAERKGEIKTRIPELQKDLDAYQRELDAYRATLTYVE